MPHAHDLDRILNDLQSKEEKVREAAQSDLFRLRHIADELPAEQGLKALRAAAQPYPFDKPVPGELSEYLVDVAARRPRPEYVPIVVELFGKFSSRAKWWAQAILTGLDSREAASAYMETVRRHGPSGEIPRLLTGPLAQRPRHADIIFPELLAYARVPTLSFDIYRLCLAYADAGLVSVQTLAPFANQVVSDYCVLADQLLPAQQTAGVAWMWENSYAGKRVDAGLLLDLLGRFPAADTEAVLRRALEYRDPRLKYFAIQSLLRLGRPVGPRNVEEVAAHAEMRNWLYDELRARGQLEIFPQMYCTQAAFAEANLVNWLTYPTELGRVPDEIELMNVLPIDTGLPDGIFDYYLFRFRTHQPHWSAKHGWTAGVAGPFRRTDEPTTEALGDTFSTFTPWENKPPVEHIGDIRELMARWREYHAQTRN
jgi:hypothetical protein